MQTKTQFDRRIILSYRDYLILQHAEYPVGFLLTDGYPAGKSAERGKHSLFFAKSKAGKRDTLPAAPDNTDARVDMPAKNIAFGLL